MKSHNAVIAFDPGLKAVAVACSLANDAARLFRLRFKKADHGYHVERGALREVFDCFRPGANPLVVIEKVKGRGGWSAASNFTFGYTVAPIVDRASELGLTVVSVEPQLWQGVVHDPDSHEKPKLRSLEAYCRLFPHQPLDRIKGAAGDHNAIDALLLAYWGARYLGAPSRAWRFG